MCITYDDGQLYNTIFGPLIDLALQDKDFVTTVQESQVLKVLNARARLAQLMTLQHLHTSEH